MIDSYLYMFVFTNFSHPCKKAVLTQWAALYIGAGIQNTGYHYDSLHDLGIVDAARGSSLCVHEV